MADEYTSSSYFALEYSISGKTAQECNKAFLAGYSAAQDEIKLLRAQLNRCREQRLSAIAKNSSYTEARVQNEMYDHELNALTIETIGESDV